MHTQPKQVSYFIQFLYIYIYIGLDSVYYKVFSVGAALGNNSVLILPFDQPNLFSSVTNRERNLVYLA